MNTAPHHLGTLTLRSLDGATAVFDARAIPAGTVVILQCQAPATFAQLDATRKQLVERLGEETANRILIVDGTWRIWPITVTEPEARASRTFTFRAAGEVDDVTVALHSLADCAICGGRIPSGSFVVVHPSDDEPDRWAHESCARPGQPARPPLNADHTARS